MSAGKLSSSAGRAEGHLPFALWNRSANRLVVAILASPLHPLCSGRLALITVTGRRSGRRHTLPVGYTEHDGRLTIPVLWPGRKRWWRNLRGGAAVQVRLRGDLRRGHGEVVREEPRRATVEVVLDADEPR
jgi:hypothetical protein